MNETNSNLDGVVGELSSQNYLLQPKLVKTTFGTVMQGSQYTAKKPVLRIATESGLSKTNNSAIRQPVISTVKPRKNVGSNLIRQDGGKMGIEDGNSPNPSNPPSDTVSCPDGYNYSAINNICYKCPDEFIYNETDNNCYPSDNNNDTIDDGGGYGGGYTPIPPSETQPAEGGYATEDTKVDENGEQKMKEKSMKKVDKKYFWYAGIVAGLLIIGYLVKKNK